MRSKKMKKLKIQVAKLTNHNRTQTRKLRNKTATPSSATMTSTRKMQSPQGSTSNSEVMSPTSTSSVLWVSFSPATKKKSSRNKSDSFYES